MEILFYYVLGFFGIPSRSFLPGLLQQGTPEIFASPAARLPSALPGLF